MESPKGTPGHPGVLGYLPTSSTFEFGDGTAADRHVGGLIEDEQIIPRP